MSLHPTLYLSIVVIITFSLVSGLQAAPDPWLRADCLRVANAWYKYGVQFSSQANTRQYVVNGSNANKYRADSSGFVSAAWNLNAPGTRVKVMKFTTISQWEMKPCDAIVPLDPGAAPLADFISLYSGQTVADTMLFFEECGQTTACCNKSQSTCPGQCGSSVNNCLSMCLGCPLQLQPRTDLSRFKIVRRNNW